MELGPIQKKWIKSLRKNPDRQMKGYLGKKQGDGSYKACCLGELCLIAGKGNWNEDGELMNNYSRKVVIDYEDLGLYSQVGADDHHSLSSLSTLNDHAQTWPEIADIVEENPSKYFSKSY